MEQADRNTKKREPQVQVWRGFEIDRLIAKGTYPNVRSLMKRFEVSEATILRDIDRLKIDFNAPIAYDRVRKGYYYTHPAFRIPAHLSTEKEIVAAQLMTNLLETVRGTPLYQQAVEVFASLATDVDDNAGTGLAKKLSNRIVFLGMNPVPISDDVWGALEEALAQNRYITFDYTFYDGGMPQKVTLEPWQLLYAQGMWTLYGYSPEKRGTRMYNLPLVSHVQLKEETFELPEDFSYTARANGNFHRYIGPETYAFKIRITRDITLNFIKTYQWADDQRFEPQTDGSTIMTFTSNQYYPVLNWVLSHGQWATPLAPARLVTEWQEQVRGMGENAEKI